MKAFYYCILLALFAVLPAVSQGQEPPLSAEPAPVFNQLKYHSYLFNPAFAISHKNETYLGLFHRAAAFGVQDNPERYFLGYNGQLGERTGLALALIHDREGVIDLNSVQASLAHELWLGSELRMSLGLQAMYRNSRLSLNRAVATIASDPSLDQEPGSLLGVNPGIAVQWRNTELALSATNLAVNVSFAGVSELYNSFGSFNASLAQTFEVDARNESFLKVQAYTQQREWGESSYGLTAWYEDPRLGWAQGGYDQLYGLHAGLGITVLPALDVQYSFEYGAGALREVASTHGIGITWHMESANPRSNAPVKRVRTPKSKKPKAKKTKEQAPTKKVSDRELERLKEELEEAKNTITLQREEINYFSTENDSLRSELEKLRRELNILKNQRVSSQNSAGLGDNSQITTTSIDGVKDGYYLILSTYKNSSDTKKAKGKYDRIGVETNWFIDKKTNTYYLFWKRFTNRESAVETLRIITESDYKDEAWIVRIVSD